MYEFHRGKPWTHEVLVAPFDVPIYKYESVLEAEKDSALKSFVPFYRLDTLVLEKKMELYDSFFEKEWGDYLNKISSETALYLFGKELDKIKDSFYEDIKYMVNKLYHQGIVSDAPQFESIKNIQEAVNIITGQVVEEKRKNSVFTQIIAYQFIRDQLSKISEQNQPGVPKERRFLEICRYYPHPRADFLGCYHRDRNALVPRGGAGPRAGFLRRAGQT